MATASASNTPPNKSDFVRDYLNSNPMAGARAVNQAWNEAGHAGKISDTLVHRLRAEKGLTGNLRSGPGAGEGRSASATGSGAKAGRRRRATKPGARRGRPPRSARPVDAETAGASAAEAADTGPLDAASLEAEFDHLLFRVMGQGMPDVEEAIRQARRLLVLHEGR